MNPFSFLRKPSFAVSASSFKGEFRRCTTKPALAERLEERRLLSSAIKTLVSIDTLATPATQLVVTTQPPATITAGVAAGLVVEAEDNSGTVDSSFTGLVTVSDPDGNLAGTLAVNAVAGVATFNNVQLDLSGPQTLAVDGGGLTEGMSNSVTVNPAAATQLALSGPSQNVLPGAPFSFDALALDPFGNVDTNYTGAVTLALNANPSGSTLGGALTVNAVAGDAGFSELTLNNAGSGYTLTATATGLTMGTSQPFEVTTDQLVVTTGVSQTVAPLSPFIVTLSAEDGAGMVDPSFTGAVTVSLIDQETGGGTAATLGGALTVSAAAGVVTLSDLTVDQPGDYALLFTATGVGPTSSSGFTVASLVSTTITLAASAASVSLDEPDTFTATVSSGAGGSTGAGTVTFFNGTTTLGTATVQDDGSAILTTAALPAGNDSVTAEFEGNANFPPSAPSSPVSVTVGVGSTAAPNLRRFVFPAVAVAGQPIKTNLPLVIANNGAALKGRFTVLLFVDMSTTLDGNQVQVGKLRPLLSLKTGKSATVRFNLHSLPGTLPPGSYYFLVETIDPTSAPDVESSATSLVIQAPVVTLNAAGGSVKPGTIKLNHVGIATVTLTDTGNIDAIGLLVIVLNPSSDGATPVAGITLATLRRKVHLHLGRPVAFPIHFKVTTALPASSYQAYFSVSLDGVVATAVGNSFVAG